MSEKKCPNIKSPEWEQLVEELNGNRLLAMLAYRKNGNEIPSPDSYIVQNLKPSSILNRGREVNVSLIDELTEEDFYTTKDGDKINRISNFIKNFSQDHRIKDKDYITAAADKLWEGKDKETFRIVNRDGEAENYVEYIERRTFYMRKAAAKGKILHLAIEMVVNNNKIEENTRRIKDILKEFEDQFGVNDIYWEWILKKDSRELKNGETEEYFVNIERIFDNMGINYFKKNGGTFDDLTRDLISSEVTVESEEFGLAGSIDLLVQHSDNTYSIYDFKTGQSFSGRPELEDLFLMKYGDQGTKEITDNFRNKAKLQIMLYAIMLKAKNPGIKFRNLEIAWIPNEYIIQSRDVDAAVDVSSFLKMIEDFLSDKKMLKGLGMDPNIKEKLLEKDKNIFNPKEYTSAPISDEIEDEIFGKGKSPQQVLDEKISELKYITTKNIDFRNLSQEDQQRARTLSEDITKMLQEGNVVITKDSYHDMNLFERYFGNYSEVSHPAVEVWKKFKNSRENLANENARKKIKKFRSLLRPVLEEVDRENPGLKILGRKSFAYDEIYKWAFVKINSEDDTGKVHERLLTNKETDPELKKQFESLSPAKKRLLNYINTTFKDYFVGEDAFMNSTATYDHKGNPISYMELYNKKKAKIDKRKYVDGWFFKLPMKDEEIMRRAGGGNIIKGLFKKDTLMRMLYEKATLFKEKEFENWFDSTTAIPIKYLGNEYIDSSGLYTHNLKDIFERAVESMEFAEQMHDVYSLGVALKNKLEIEKDPDNPYNSMYKNLVGFLDAKLIHDVQRKSKPVRWLRTKKVRLPMYNPKTGIIEQQPVSLDAILQALRSWGSAVTMWIRPFRGIGNGMHAMILVHREGAKGSLMRKLGLKEYDITEKDVASATKEYSIDFVPNAIRGTVRKSKMYLMAKKFNYFGDNYDYEAIDLDGKGKINKEKITEWLYSPYSLPEEAVSMITMAATLKKMKNPKTGKSLWDSYEIYELTDENGKGTGEYDVKWVGGIRGITKKGTGDTAIYKEITGITENELAHIKKVHERLQGGYRREEATSIEVTIMGKLFMQLKKYLPRLLLNGMHRKRIETDLGEYKQVVDDKGNPVMRKENGEELPLYEWHARVTEGRWITIGGTLFNILTLGRVAKSYGIKSLNEEQRANLIEASLVFVNWLFTYGLYITLFGDVDDDDSSKKLFKQYLVDNLTQQYNIADILRSIKSSGTPVALSKLIDFSLSGMEMILAITNYAIGNDDLAFTKKGDLRGWNNFAKGIPFFASIKDIANKLEHNKSGLLDPSDWLYGNVRLR